MKASILSAVAGIVCAASVVMAQSSEFDAGTRSTTTPEPPFHLVNGAFLLDRVGFGDGRVLRPNEGEEYSLNFGPDLSVSGRVNCNNCSGSYTFTDTTLKLGVMVCTMIGCSPGAIENTYHEVMTDERPFQAEDSRLLIFFNQMQDTLVFHDQHLSIPPVRHPGVSTPTTTMSPGLRGRGLRSGTVSPGKRRNVRGRLLR